MPLSFAFVPFSLSTGELLLSGSAGFSTIDSNGASKKYGSIRARVHTAYTTFPQAAKTSNSSHRLSQLHAIAQETCRISPGKRTSISANRQEIAAQTLWKKPPFKKYFSLTSLVLRNHCAKKPSRCPKSSEFVISIS